MNEIEDTANIDYSIEDDLIDIEKELCHTKESNWLFNTNKEQESNVNQFDDASILKNYSSFSQLKFSSPYINNLVKSIYQNGNSKQMLHNLMYLSENRMTISCDDYYSSSRPISSIESHSMLYSQIAMPTSRSFSMNHHQRYSVIPFDRDLTPTIQDDDSPPDSLNGSQHFESIINNTDLPSLIDERMIQSSISDYNYQDSSIYAPQESTTGPRQNTTGTSSSTQNILSRTYDKEDLERLKQEASNQNHSQMSQSVYVPPNITDLNDLTTQKEDVGCKEDVMSRSFTTRSRLRKQKQQQQQQQPKYLKRLFPTTTTDLISNKISINQDFKSKKNQVDLKLNHISDQRIKIKSHNTPPMTATLSPRPLLKMTSEIFDCDVITPTNFANHSTAPLSTKLQPINGQSKLRQPMVVKKSQQMIYKL